MAGERKYNSLTPPGYPHCGFTYTRHDYELFQHRCKHAMKLSPKWQDYPLLYVLQSHPMFHHLSLRKATSTTQQGQQPWLVHISKFNALALLFSRTAFALAPWRQAQLPYCGKKISSCLCPVAF